MTDPRPIGVFDSGIGGLTVLAALTARLPGERFVYLGDTARLPYGSKSSDTVKRYALRAGLYLSEQGIKMLVVACNTAASAALPVLEQALSVPVIGVVGPGARIAVRESRRAIGMIGTESTVASGAYERAIRELRPGASILARACPLFVPLAEEGWFDHPVTREVAHLYLGDMASSGVDTLILGCTHYPLLREAIAAAVGDGVRLVDSASSVALAVGETLASEKMTAPAGTGDLRLLVTDAAPRVRRIAGLILGEAAERIELVDLPSYATAPD